VAGGTGQAPAVHRVDQRGLDLLNPVWHLLDLTPGGRGDWYAALSYGPPTV